jgi:CBS domain-containing protein
MYEFIDYRVRDFMSAPAVSIDRHATLADAEEVFEKHDFNCLPVTESGRLVGILTKLDFLGAFVFSPRVIVPAYPEIMRNAVARSMSRDLVAVAPDEPLTRVLEKMVRTRYKSFPVVGDGQLVGVISRSDVLLALKKAAATAVSGRSAQA